MPPQARRRPLGPPSAITTGVSQRPRPGMGESIIEGALSGLRSGLQFPGEDTPLGATDLGTLGGIVDVPLAGGAAGPTEPDFLALIRQALKESVL